MGFNSRNNAHEELNNNEDEFQIDDVDLSELELDILIPEQCSLKQNNVTITTRSYNRQNFNDRLSDRRFLCKEINIDNMCIKENEASLNNNLFKICMEKINDPPMTTNIARTNYPIVCKTRTRTINSKIKNRTVFNKKRERSKERNKYNNFL